MQDPRTLSIQRRGDVAHVAVLGEFDLVAVPEVTAAIEEERDHERSIVLDLSGLTFMDSSGIAVLIEGMRMAPGAISFVPPTGQPLRALELCGLLDRLPWVAAPVATA